MIDNILIAYVIVLTLWAAGMWRLSRPPRHPHDRAIRDYERRRRQIDKTLGGRR